MSEAKGTANTQRSRNANRKFLRDYFLLDGAANTANLNVTAARKFIYDYAVWVYAELSQGRHVELYPLGTFILKFRKKRSWVGVYRVNQPDQYVVKFYASRGLKQQLKQLAIEYPDPKTLPMHQYRGRGSGKRITPFAARAHHYKKKPDQNQQQPLTK